jgi:hypothetical protein
MGVDLVRDVADADAVPVEARNLVPEVAARI